MILSLWMASPDIALAQSGMWTWLKGPQSSNVAGVYGTQGVAAAANCPPAMVNQFSWTASDGTFWLYGGQDHQSNGLAALWKYDPATNMWTWMKGPNTFGFTGEWGTQGVASATNLPPAKTFGGNSWVDLDGNFWMYGGENGDNYNGNMNNDLWKYDPLTNMWTWMKGSNMDDQPAVWGTMGVPDVDNQPPPRANGYATWADDDGDLWLFGGVVPGGESDDLWRYHIATNTWTWMSGSQTPNASAVYGTQGAQSPANTPGGRVGVSLGKDADGKLWLQGGGYIGSYYGWGDLWRLDPSTGQWAWMSGSSAALPQPVYGPICMPEPANDPGKRLLSPTWQTPDGRMWSFGVVSNSGNPGQNFTRSDLWTFCPSTLEWTWVHGPTSINPAGNWGTLGVSAPSNLPPGRDNGSWWTAPNGDLYLFGGATIGTPQWYSDLWRFTPDPACGACGSNTAIGTSAGEPVPQIIPNPSYGTEARMQLPPGNWHIVVHDGQGRVAGGRSSVQNGAPPPVELDAGVYLVTMRNGQVTHTVRWVVQR